MSDTGSRWERMDETEFDDEANYYSLTGTKKNKIKKLVKKQSINKTEFDTIERILNRRGYKYIVPDLQRGFVWDGQHISQLIRSINQHRKENRNLYLGTIMTERKGNEFDIVDGQQRITTISILARCLLEEEEIKKDNDIIKRLRKMIYNNGKPRLTHNTTPDKRSYHELIEECSNWRLKVKEYVERIESKKAQDKEIKEKNNILKTEKENRKGMVKSKKGYKESLEITNKIKDEIQKLKEGRKEVIKKIKDEKKYFQTDGESYSYYNEKNWDDLPLEENRIFNCYKVINKEISLIREGNELEDFVNFLLRRVEVIKVEIIEESQVYLIFRSMNAFGKGLSQAELVKSEIFHMASTDAFLEDIKKKWDEITNILRGVDKNQNSDVISDFLFAYVRATQVFEPQKQGGTRKTAIQKSDFFSKVFDSEYGIFNSKCKNIDASGNLVPDKAEILKFMNELIKWSKGYVLIKKPVTIAENIAKNSTRDDIIDLQRISTEQVAPFILASYMNSVGKNENDKNRKEFEWYIRCLSYLVTRYSLATEIPSHRLTGKISDLLLGLKERKEKKEIAASVINIIADNYGIDIKEKTMAKIKQDIETEFKSKIQQKEFKDQNSAVKLLIRGAEGIESWSDEKALIKQSHNSAFYTTEHILPKSIGRFSARKGDIYNEQQKFLSLGDGFYEQKDNYSKYRYKLGNYILLEAGLNKSAGVRTLRGVPIDDKSGSWEFIPFVNKTSSPKSEPPKKPKQKKTDWGKLQIFQYKEWEHEGEKYYGSHLKSIRKFVTKIKKEDIETWGTEQIDERTNQLAEEISKYKNWKI